MVGATHSSASMGSKNIEKMINSSLDDIVKETRRERQLKKRTEGFQSQGKGARTQDVRRKNVRKPQGVNLNVRGGFKSSPNRGPRGGRITTGGRGEKGARQTRDHMRNIQIVAKLESLPTPTAQQRAGMSSLEVIPSSISSQKARRNRVFG